MLLVLALPSAIILSLWLMCSHNVNTHPVDIAHVCCERLRISWELLQAPWACLLVLKKACSLVLAHAHSVPLPRMHTHGVYHVHIWQRAALYGSECLTVNGDI